MEKMLQQGRGGGYKIREADYLCLILLVPGGYEYGSDLGLTIINNGPYLCN